MGKTKEVSSRRPVAVAAMVDPDIDIPKPFVLLKTEDPTKDQWVRLAQWALVRAMGK